MKKIEGANAQALELRERVNLLKRRRDKLNKEIEDTVEKMHVACIHNETRVQDDYIPGSYYDRCQYVKIYICKVCGKEVDRIATYGGYG